MTFNPKAYGPQSACFAYALNQPRLGIANIGGVKQIIPAWRNANTIHDVAFITKLGIQDGLIPQEERNFNPAKEHIIAVFTKATYDSFHDEYDYDCHHIRLDGDHSWSHKPGKTNASKFILPEGKKLSDALHDAYDPKRYLRQVESSWFIGFFKFPEQGMEAKLRL